MKFDYIIGNPPYQEETEGNGRKSPLYHLFMDAAYSLSARVELVTPARFLSDMGQTPSAWNQRMLSDPHFKVLDYWPDSKQVFHGVDIKGGIAITYRDEDKDFGPIEVFSPITEVNSALHKIIRLMPKGESLENVVSPRGIYRFSEQFYDDFPEQKQRVEKTGTGNMVVSNIFVNAPDAFIDHVENRADYYRVIGRTHNHRVSKFIKSSYIIGNPYLSSYNVALPKSNGTGQFGECLSSPFVLGPNEGVTDTFISIGLLHTEEQALNLLKYLTTKFLRAMLGVKKITQDNPRSAWKYVPLQDFTSSSDIDWTQSVSDIDKQLYKKYNLTGEEIDFIEKNVKEMK